jgi:hypothetical protein
MIPIVPRPWPFGDSFEPVAVVIANLKPTMPGSPFWQRSDSSRSVQILRG